MIFVKKGIVNLKIFAFSFKNWKQKIRCKVFAEYFYSPSANCMRRDGMRRLICIGLSFVISLLCGCAEQLGKPAFECTQERVCKPIENPQGYELFSRAKDTGIVIPGLKQNFVPQGICCWETENVLLISGYFLPLSGNLSAVLLAVDSTTGKLVGEYTLADSSGRDLGGHFSGVAVSQRDLFVTGRRCLYRIPLTALSEAGNSGKLQVEEKIDLNMSVDACNYVQGELWACEYYQAENYPLEAGHEAMCSDGAVHYAWMIGCAVEDGLEIKCILSIPNEIQGITRLPDGRFLMSQSYGRRNPSALLIYENPRTQPPDAVVELEGEKIPLWHLDSRFLIDTISAPPMSEGCCASKGGVYLLFESAAYFYNGLDPENRSVHPIDTVWYLPMDK